MPLSIPESIAKSLPEPALAVFTDALAFYSGNGHGEVQVMLKAYRAVEDAGYTYDSGTWIAKDVMTVSDVHADGPLPGLTEAFSQGKKRKPKRKDDPGTEDIDLEKYSPDQERDDHGRFGEGSGVDSKSSEKIAAENKLDALPRTDFSDVDPKNIFKDVVQDAPWMEGHEHQIEAQARIRAAVEKGKMAKNPPEISAAAMRHLTSSQEMIDPEQVRSLIASYPAWETNPKEGRPVIASLNGRQVLVDGHHRVVAAMMLGVPVHFTYVSMAGLGSANKVEKTISGTSSIPLNAEGEKLARRLGERLAAKGGLDVLFHSPLKRAVETADAIVEADTNELYRADPVAALEPWHFPQIEGKDSSDVEDLIKYYIEHPDEVPPGDGADGEPGESFNDAKERQMEFFQRIYADFEEQPTLKIGVVMHSRGMEFLQSWVDDGCPKSFELDTKELLHPDDPDHATALRWHGDEIKEVDLDSDDPLKPGVYPILHSLTDDDTDEGNEQLEKTDLTKLEHLVKKTFADFGPVKKYLPPVEVAAAARKSYDMGISVIGVTAPLAEGESLAAEEIQKIDAHFADIANLTEPVATTNAWGGRRAQRWASRVLRTIEKYSPDQERDDHGRFGSGSGGSGGAKTHDPGVKVSPTSKKAWSGKQVDIKDPPSKQETGKLGEAIVLAHLQSKGMTDARPLNAEVNNFPVDLIQDHGVIEVKTGLASNGDTAQHWRATIGQPGPTETAWLKTATTEEKRDWNNRKAAEIIQRKEAAAKQISKDLGHSVKGSTMTVILNPNTKTADLYEFKGFHSRIVWDSDQAKKGYIGSVKYE